MKFTIVVTEDCNLRCSYCYEGDNKNTSKMNFQTADKVINFIAKKINEESDDVYQPIVIFHGGEPLLNFEIIKYIYNKLNNVVKKNIRYDMTTNGTILNDEIEEFILNNIDALSISLDGIKESHNKFRIFANGSGSYDIVIKNARRLLSKSSNLRVRMTFSMNTVKYMYESVKEMHKMGFKYIVPALDKLSQWDEHSIKTLENQVDKVVAYKKENIEAKISTADIITLNTKKGDCFGGVVSFCIGSKGLVYPCAYAIGKDEFIIGNVNNTNSCLNKSKIEEMININRVGSENCKGCTRYEYCSGPRCKIINKLATDDYNLPSYMTCISQHMEVRATKSLMDKINI
ncbi:MAG: radical SAM protein [Romboutsia sp.]